MVPRYFGVIEQEIKNPYNEELKIAADRQVVKIFLNEHNFQLIENPVSWFDLTGVSGVVSFSYYEEQETLNKRKFNIFYKAMCVLLYHMRKTAMKLLPSALVRLIKRRYYKKMGLFPLMRKINKNCVFNWEGASISTRVYVWAGVKSFFVGLR